MQSIRFAAKFEFLDEIREFVGDIARNGGFGEKDVYNIQLATDEAASNIIEHAYEGIPDGVLDISCGMEADTIKITLVRYAFCIHFRLAGQRGGEFTTTVRSDARQSQRCEQDQNDI